MENSSTQLSQKSEADPNSVFRLSIDLVLHVMQFLDPLDILSMRKTCRMFHRTTKARIVWLVALQRICETHGIFKPTFPTNRMSLLELEHAALSPHRFVKSIKAAENINPAHPHQNRSIPRRGRADPNSNEIRRELFLIPGGRFLLSSEGRSGVCLWDLGYNARIPINPFPIATLDLPGSSLKSVVPSEGGKELLLAVTSRLDNVTVLRIYRVDPEVPGKGFSMEGQLEIDANLATVGSFLCCDAIYLVHESHFIVWNWIENTGCKWESHIVPLDLPEIYGCKQSIIAYDRDDGIGVWDIPILVSVTKPNLGGFHVVENSQKYSFMPLLVDGTADILFSGTSAWQQELTSTLHLLRLVDHETADEDYNLTVYSLRDTEKVNDPFLPRLLPVLGGHSKYIHGDGHPALSRGAVSSLFTCDSHLFFCTGSETDFNGSDLEIVAVVLPIPSQFSKDSIDVYPMTLMPSGVDEWISSDQIGFCPMSGRLVYLLSGGEELRLADYLLPPGELSHQENS
ncbi:hypothetical protein H1R20_g10700, partial [Candolleomyces eurysporus]